METEVSLPHLQEPATCPYPEPDQSNSCPIPLLERSILLLSTHPVVTLASPNYFCEFRKSGIYKLSRIATLIIFRVQGAATRRQEVKEKPMQNLQNNMLIGAGCWTCKFEGDICSFRLRVEIDKE
jgi:hypothetical protein